LIKHGRAVDKGFPFGEKKCTARAYSIAVCVLFYSRSLCAALSRGREVWMISSNRGAATECRGRKFIQRPRCFDKGASTVWFSRESYNAAAAQHQCLFMIHLATPCRFNNPIHNGAKDCAKFAFGAVITAQREVRCQIEDISACAENGTSC
jgi:hypothetical protein